MLNTNFEAVVTDIKFKMDNSGNVVPVVVLMNDKSIQPYYCDIHSRNVNKTDIGAGDVVNVSQCNISNTFDYEISIKQISNKNSMRCPIYLLYCPFCHQPLIRQNINESFGKCYNKSCNAQISYNIQFLTMAVGLHFSGIHRTIFLHLLTRNVFKDLTDIFNINEKIIFELDNLNIKQTDVNSFISYIKEFKSSINLAYLLHGINIPGLSLEDIDFISKLFNNNYHNFYNFIRSNNNSLFPPELIDKINRFLCIEPNRIMLDKFEQVFIPS